MGSPLSKTNRIKLFVAIGILALVLFNFNNRPGKTHAQESFENWLRAEESQGLRYQSGKIELTVHFPQGANKISYVMRSDGTDVQGQKLYRALELIREARFFEENETERAVDFKLSAGHLTFEGSASVSDAEGSVPLGLLLTFMDALEKSGNVTKLVG